MKIVVLLVGVVGLYRDVLSLGAVYLFVYYIDMMEDPIMDMRIQLEIIPNIEESKKRINDIISLREDELSYGSKSLDKKVEEIVVDSISFSY